MVCGGREKIVSECGQRPKGFFRLRTGGQAPLCQPHVGRARPPASYEQLPIYPAYLYLGHKSLLAMIRMTELLS